MNIFKSYLYGPAGAGQRVAIPITGSNAVPWTSTAPAALIQALDGDILFSLDGSAPVAPNAFLLKMNAAPEVWSAVRLQAARFVGATVPAGLQVNPVA